MRISKITLIYLSRGKRTGGGMEGRGDGRNRHIRKKEEKQQDDTKEKAAIEDSIPTRR